ncbi:MAG: acyltransferase [Planctomycetaceae bacterium]|nr:acyltransferase [Planctomycetaceae bacterium]
MMPKVFFFYLQCTIRIKDGTLNANQPILLIGQGSVEVAGKSSIGYYPSPGYFSSYAHIEARRPNSKIKFGNGTHINNAFTAIAEHTSISIGNNCRIGPNTTIFDSDFHGVTVTSRSTSKPEAAKPVIIEDDVFIGANVLIMKGVLIGQGSVIAAGSVVTGKIPNNVIAGGNPCRIIANLEAENE